MTGSHAGSRGVLLVHGAWFTGRVWSGVAGRLRGLGIRVAVAELHRGSLAADIAAASQALAEIAEFGPVVACGHSYGGTVITGLDPGRLDHLVYLAAPMPDVGETSLELLSRYPSGLAAAMLVDADGTATIDRAQAGELFFSHLTEQQRAEHVATLVPQAIAAGHERTTRAAWHYRPSTYVVCSDDRVVSPDLQRLLSERATHTITWDSDHAAIASHETETVELLHGLAERLLALGA